MYFNLDNTRDIHSVIKRRFRGQILEKDDNVFGKDKFGNQKDFLHVVQFPLKKQSKQDISIFTDGSRLQEKGIEFNGKKKEEVVYDEVYGFGAFIENKEKDIQTYGVVSNLSYKFPFDDKDQNASTKIIELIAIKDALLNLENHYENLKERNIQLYSDNLLNLKDLNVMIKLQLTPESEEAPKLRKRLYYLKKESRYELLKQIADFVIEYNINLSWVRGHQGFRQNEIVDQLAKHAVRLEKKDYLTGTSRINHVYGVHTSTEIKVKGEQQILKDHLDVKLHQKYDDGETSLMLVDNQLKFRHANKTVVKSKINNDTTLFVKSHYEHNYDENKDFYQQMTLKDIEKGFNEQNQALIGKINNANFNSMITLINEYAIKEKYDISKLSLLINTTSLSSFVADYFFKTLDSNFNAILPNIRNIPEINIQYIQPLEKMNVKRFYDFVKDNKVYQLYQHPNDAKFEHIKNAIEYIPEEAIREIKELRLKGEVNEFATTLLRNNILKNKSMKDDEILKELTQDIENAKIKINPLADLRGWRKR